MRRTTNLLAVLPLLGAASLPAELSAQIGRELAPTFEPMDVFGIELGGDPRISPDGERVVFVRTGFDVLTDARVSNLWLVPYEGGEARPLTTGSRTDASPRWSPDGGRLAYTSNAEGGSEIWLRWMDTGQTAKLTSLVESPGSLTWSPDGRWLAFTLFVPGEEPRLAIDMPAPPRGADWGPAWKYIDDLDYRADGRRYVRSASRHLFVVPAEGGTPRQLTDGDFDHGSPAWTPDGRAIVFSADRARNVSR